MVMGCWIIDIINDGSHDTLIHHVNVCHDHQTQSQDTFLYDEFVYFVIKSVD